MGEIRPEAATTLPPFLTVGATHEVQDSMCPIGKNFGDEVGATAVVKCEADMPLKGKLSNIPYCKTDNDFCPE